MIFQNSMKRALKDGNVVFGPMVSEMRSSGIAVLFAQAGFDFFFIDLEHSCFSLETVSDMILAARAADIPVIVRPSSRKSAEYLSRPLDSGASGLLIPQIRTRQDVENVVKWCRYQPLGERGMGLARQHTFFQGGDALDTMKQLNEEILIALQIENKDAVENLSDLLSVPGIDAAFVGPADLTATCGKPARSDDPEIQSPNERVNKARFWVAKGMKMIGFCTDIKLIQQVCQTSVQELHAAQ